METQRKKQTQRRKNLFTMTSGGFVTVVTNNFKLQQIAFFRAYIVAI